MRKTVQGAGQRTGRNIKAGTILDRPYSGVLRPEDPADATLGNVYRLIGMHPRGHAIPASLFSSTVAVQERPRELVQFLNNFSEVLRRS